MVMLLVILSYGSQIKVIILWIVLVLLSGIKIGSCSMRGSL